MPWGKKLKKKKPKAKNKGKFSVIFVRTQLSKTLRNNLMTFLVAQFKEKISSVVWWNNVAGWPPQNKFSGFHNGWSRQKHLNFNPGFCVNFPH